MAYDKVVDSAELEAGLTKLANAIREKGGTTDLLAFPDEMETAVKAITGGSGGEVYEGSYIVIPNTAEQILFTAGKTMLSDIKIVEIPYAEVSNNTGGITVTIGGK